MAEYFLTYAQNAEDVMLWRALQHVTWGFYIDVGAQDPITDSVTKAFSEHGWRGINIEPVKHWHERLVADRPHDINLQVAASGHVGEITLFDVEDTGLSTADAALAQKHREQGWTVREVSVPCRTLDDICAEYGVDAVHFLKIDCEGSEKQVLEGIALDAIRPWIILVEATEPLSDKPTHQKWEHLLVQRGYGFVYFDGLNRFYLADEHRDLGKAFRTPPNPLDWAFRAVQVRAQVEIKELTERLAQLTSVERVTLAESERDQLRSERERLEAELERVQAERQSAQESVQERDAQVAKLTVERERSLGEVMRLAAELERARTAAQTLIAEHAELMATCESLRGEVEHARAAHRGLENAFRETEANAGALRARLDELYGSRSWRVTAPLRMAGRAARGSLRAFVVISVSLARPFAHMARPSMRRMARWPWLRRTVTGVFGRDSRFTATARLFLFGAPYRSMQEMEATQRKRSDEPIPTKDARSTGVPSVVTLPLHGAGVIVDGKHQCGSPASEHERLVRLILEQTGPKQTGNEE